MREIVLKCWRWELSNYLPRLVISIVKTLYSMTRGRMGRKGDENGKDPHVHFILNVKMKCDGDGSRRKDKKSDFS